MFDLLLFVFVIFYLYTCSLLYGLLVFVYGICLPWVLNLGYYYYYLLGSLETVKNTNRHLIGSVGLGGVRPTT